MHPFRLTVLLFCLPLLLAAPAALGDPPPGKGPPHKIGKAERAGAKEQRKSERAWAKAERKAAQAWSKAERKAAREQQKALRQAQRAEARDGWYDGEGWRSYDAQRRYRNDAWVALRSYPAPAWTPPPDFSVRIYEPGVRLPATWYEERYYIVHDPYGLPPPPPRHRWVQVDDDAVLVALATGLVADFVYDLFE